MWYLVMIRRTRTGYSADVPDLPGCIATGATVEQTRQVIAEAVEAHLELVAQSGEAISSPTTHSDFAVDDDSAEEFCTWIEAEVATTAGP
jgi:predicted RNase H-like HicB family nuclease